MGVGIDIPGVQELSNGLLSKVSSSFETVFTLAGKVINTVTSNEILLVFFASGLIGLAISVVRRFKRT